MTPRFLVAFSRVWMFFLVSLCHTLAPMCSVSSDNPHVPCCLEWLTILNPQLELLNMWSLNLNFCFFLALELELTLIPKDILFVPLFLGEWSHNQLLKYHSPFHYKIFFLPALVSLSLLTAKSPTVSIITQTVPAEFIPSSVGVSMNFANQHIKLLLEQMPPWPKELLPREYWVLWPRLVFRPQPIPCHSSSVN